MDGILGSIGKFLGECVTELLESNWDSTQREVFGLEKDLKKIEEDGEVLSEGAKYYYHGKVNYWLERLPNDYQLAEIADDDVRRYYRFLSKSIINSRDIYLRISKRR